MQTGVTIVVHSYKYTYKLHTYMYCSVPRFENTPSPLFSPKFLHRVHTCSLTRFNAPWRASSGNLNYTSATSVGSTVQCMQSPLGWTDSIAVLEDGYSVVVVNVMALKLKWQLFTLM